jgi:hypothetical protein
MACIPKRIGIRSAPTHDLDVEEANKVTTLRPKPRKAPHMAHKQSKAHE